MKLAIYIPISLLITMTCSLATAEPLPIEADLARLATPSADEKIPPFAGQVFGGGKHMVNRKQLMTRKADVVWADSRLELRLQPSNG